MLGSEIEHARDYARAFEAALPPAKRKELGQFFSGMKLGRVLAFLAATPDTELVCDPMAGSGDLLDAALEAADREGASFQRLDGIEIDAATAHVCQQRLRQVLRNSTISPLIMNGDAFDPSTHENLPLGGYDLVITNPPYVRYQALNGRAEKVRQGLLAIAESRLQGSPLEVWRSLIAGYSGLADLSVPAWLLSALLVKPGGRLALVVPATWRSRAYADVIRYLLLRCFALEIVVEDTQPGWFSDALVRTHLILARRLSDHEMVDPLGARPELSSAVWLQVAPEAASESSLVGCAFDAAEPEAALASWYRSPERPPARGVTIRAFSLEDEWDALVGQASSREWFRKLEGVSPRRSSVSVFRGAAPAIPEGIRDCLPYGFRRESLVYLEQLGIRVGQGLRTGCNRFFYVRNLDKNETDGTVRVELDPAFGGQVLQVPAGVLRPVLHRQTDLDVWTRGITPATRVLDLRGWILPEHEQAVQSFAAAYRAARAELPRVLPDELAAHVRAAGKQPLGDKQDSKPVSALSAVKTNVRKGRASSPPRFWYMLPDFAPRHLPQAFIPRIIHGEPQVYGNCSPPMLIDANFSTLWSDEAQDWTPAAIRAFLNSVWCRTVMEAIGTPLGGGALKLEAVHLKSIPVPRLGAAAIQQLDELGAGKFDNAKLNRIDEITLRALLSGENLESERGDLAQSLYRRLAASVNARRRGAK